MTTAKTQLVTLLQHPAVWRAADNHRTLERHTTPVIATGHAQLDQALPNGGLPDHNVTEILCPHWGCGEIELLAPALAQLSRQDRWLAWVNPPWLPYAPALQQYSIRLKNILIIQTPRTNDALWAMEQCLRSGACSTVLGWPRNPLPHKVRRLQIAAQNGHSLGLLMRPQQELQQPSPAPLRLELSSLQQKCLVRVAKCRGHWGSDWLCYYRVIG